MKKINIFITMLLLVVTLSGCEEVPMDPNDETIDVKVEETVLYTNSDIDLYDYTLLWGSISALDTDYLTLDAMLIYAIEDEYSAYAEYEYILANFEVTTPFSNIINAESKHIEMLLPLFETYETEVPNNESQDYLIIPEDLEDTFRAGVAAEILNIDMYNLFLEQDLPDDVRDTFTALRDASLKHLAAFEKNLAEYE